MRSGKILLLSFAFIVLTGCGGGRTMVMTAPVTKRTVSNVAIVPMPSSVNVPEDIQSAFESKLATLLYTKDTFRQGKDLTLQYRFIQFTSGNQGVRWLVGPIGGAGEGSLTIEVQYLDENAQEIARIQSSGTVTAGLGGGP